MNLYLNILKQCLNKDNYNLYWKLVNLTYIKENLPEIYKLYLTLELMMEKQKDYNIDDLELSFYAAYPQAAVAVYSPIFKLLREAEASPDSVRDFMDSSRKREAYTELAKHSLLLAEGKSDVSEKEIESLLSVLQSESRTEEEKEPFVTDDLQELYNERRLNQGLRWRLRSLNESLGSLRKGDFGFLFARPETGKTTFLASEITHMAGQATGPIIWFNNEEQSSKVKIRCYQAALNRSLSELYSDIEKSTSDYKQIVSASIRIPTDNIISRKYVEETCKAHQPALIIFDQIDKVEGFDAERYDLKMKTIYAWARELAKQYGPVIAVCQAGATADGKKWLTMNDVDSSHTAKQGEADWMLGIGKVYDDGLEEVRYLHLSKNKLDGDTDTDPEKRHHKWETRIVPQRGRYEDF